jgi:cytochrome c-type biogenesis protein CcmH
MFRNRDSRGNRKAEVRIRQESHQFFERPRHWKRISKLICDIDRLHGYGLSFALDRMTEKVSSAVPMLRRTRRILLALVFVSAWGAAQALDGPDKLGDPALEARAAELQRQLRCVVCQGQSLDESNAPLAADLRRLIRIHIQQGESDAQIEGYLVARYGDFILMKPPLELDTYALWFGPLIVLLVGGVGAGIVVGRARARMRESV